MNDVIPKPDEIDIPRNGLRLLR